MTARRRISILGATGSVGESTLDLIARHPDEFDVIALTANQNSEKLASLAQQFNPQFVALGDEEKYNNFKGLMKDCDVETGAGIDAILHAASLPADFTMAAITGFAGLLPSLKAVEQGGTVGLANKECLVAAGDYFMAMAKHYKAKILPVDSEHNAIFQLLHGHKMRDVAELTLTASGGPFRGLSGDALKHVTPAQAVQHPVWSMGQKISVDSASLMNKGLELIEAHYLFACAPEKLSILVHPQSIIHGLIRFRDGALYAHMGVPDMRVPIAYCLGFPHRMQTPCAPLDLANLSALEFESPDRTRFPCLGLAETALHMGGMAPTALNAANEIAVSGFLAGDIYFTDIAKIVDFGLNYAEKTMSKKKGKGLTDIINYDKEIRKVANEYMRKKCKI